VRCADPRWWDRAVNALGPAALIAAMIAHAVRFFVPGQGSFPVDLNSGFSSPFDKGARLLVPRVSALLQAEPITGVRELTNSISS
jgi:hypothetical protein